MIVSTVQFQDAHTQIDGSRWVGEIHTDSAGGVHIFRYLATPEMMERRSVVSAGRVIKLEARLPEDEATAVIEADRAPVLVFQTGAQFLQRLRERFRNSDKDDSAKIARWIINRLDSGNVTALQLRTAFGLTVQQWATLEARLREMKSAIEAVDRAKGE